MPRAARKIPEPVAADDRPGLEDHPPADPGAGIADHPGVHPGILADRDAVAERDPFREPTPVAQLNPPAQHDEGPDRDPGAERTAGTDAGRGIDPRASFGRGKEPADDLDQGAVGVVHHDPRGRTRGRLRQRGRHQHDAGPRDRERARVAGRHRQGQRAGPGAVERSDRGDHGPPIAKQAATDQVGDRLRGEPSRRHRLSCRT